MCVESISTAIWGILLKQIAAETGENKFSLMKSIEKLKHTLLRPAKIISVSPNIS